MSAGKISKKVTNVADIGGGGGFEAGADEASNKPSQRSRAGSSAA